MTPLHLPRTFQYENGPTLHRVTEVNIIGNGVVTTWVSESGQTRMAYMQRVRCDQQGGGVERSMCLLTTGKTPVPMPEACETATVFFPDEILMVGYAVKEDMPPLVIASVLDGTIRRPGIN